MGGVGSGGNHGGGRPKGSKAKPKTITQVVATAGHLTHEVARELYSDPSTKNRWAKLRDAKDVWLRFHVEREISHLAAGKPRETVDLQANVNLNLDAKRQRVAELIARLAGQAGRK